MIAALKDCLWKQFGASIDMLGNAIAACPEAFYLQHKRFFYISFHTIQLLDYYLTIPSADFKRTLPFTFTEKENRPAESIDDMIPDRYYSKQELLDYLGKCRDKCRQLIDGINETTINLRFTEDQEFSDAMDYPLIEILLYNMRHVQHHAAQLNMLLSQGGIKATGWVFRAEGTEL